MIKINDNKATVFWTEKQMQFIEDLKSRKYQFLLFGGGMGSGKTQLMARIFISQADIRPNTRYFVFRKNLSVLKRTTYQTFKSVATEFNVSFSENRADNVWTFPNGSQIWFQELDESKDNDWNKIKGIEATAIGIDEVNEVQESAFNVLMGRIWRCNPNKEHSFIMATCNPTQNWVKSRFYEPYTTNTLQDKFYFLQALATDNPFLPEEYIETLRLLPEAEYERYVLGNWNFADDPNQLIKYEWIKENIWDNQEVDSMGIDVAREGNDRTVFYFGNSKGAVSKKEYRTQSTVETSIKAIEAMKEYEIGADRTAVDVVGVGGGVVDYMRAEGYNIKAFNSGESPDVLVGHLQYRNKRAQVYWELREDLQRGEYKLPDDKELHQELLSIRYTIKDRVIQIESKSELKKRMGRSPDLADALVIQKYISNHTSDILIGIF